MAQSSRNRRRQCTRTHGGQYWQYQYRFQGRRKVVSYGTFPEVSEDRARSRHRLARELLARGVDPMLKRKELRRDGLLGQEIK